MLKENILWSRVIDPMSGRVTRELTFGGVALAVIGGVAIGWAVGYFILVIVPIAFQ
jgi:hypothetical protein